jgi:hypothetical protein
MHHAPRTRQEIAEFVKEQLGLSIPDRRVCPHHDSPMDYLEASFLRQEDLLVWANRGGGKTLLAAAATLLDGLFHAPSRICVLGGSFDQSDRLAEYIREMLERRPEWLEAPSRAASRGEQGAAGPAPKSRRARAATGRSGKSAPAPATPRRPVPARRRPAPMTRQWVRLASGSEIRMLAQSQRAVRGQHVQKIRCDEVDLFDPDVWRAVQFATRSSENARGSIEVLSTLHRSGGLMAKLVEQAASNQPQATNHQPPGTSQNPPGTKEQSVTEPDAGSPGGRWQVPGGSPSGGSVGYRLIRWCLWEVIERCPPERRCRQCLLADDCRGVAREGVGFFRIDDAIAIKARSSRSAWEAEMLCKGARRDWLVFPEFCPGRHVGPEEHHRDWPLYRAIDFGYRSPLVCLWIQVSPAGRLHVIDEYVRHRLPLTQHAVEILRRDREQGREVAMTYVDPAGRQKESTSGSACTEMLAAAGIPCTWRGSTIDEGLELVRAALDPAGTQVEQAEATETPESSIADRPPSIADLVIHPRCVKLIEAFQTYHYPPPGAGRESASSMGTDAGHPVKDGPDHLIDALRYFIVNRARPRMGLDRRKY